MLAQKKCPAAALAKVIHQPALKALDLLEANEAKQINLERAGTGDRSHRFRSPQQLLLIASDPPQQLLQNSYACASFANGEQDNSTLRTRPGASWQTGRATPDAAAKRGQRWAESPDELHGA
jgi:hypothetical protein